MCACISQQEPSLFPHNVACICCRPKQQCFKNTYRKQRVSTSGVDPAASPSLLGRSHIGVKLRHPGCSKGLSWESTASLSPLVAFVRNDKSYYAVRTLVPGPLPGPSQASPRIPVTTCWAGHISPPCRCGKRGSKRSSRFPSVNQLESSGARL